MPFFSLSQDKHILELAGATFKIAHSTEKVEGNYIVYRLLEEIPDKNEIDNQSPPAQEQLIKVENTD